MSVQNTSISIEESAPIRNLTLFRIFVVENLFKLSKVKERLLSESTFLYREKLLSCICIVERHVPFPPHLRGTQCIIDGFLISIVDAMQ